MNKKNKNTQLAEVLRFLRKTLYFLAIPLFILIGLYLYMDPFKVLYDYDIYYEEHHVGGVIYNAGYINTMILTDNIGSMKYDSFILGNSRSGFYEINDWKTHLDSNAVCLHFDAAKETFDGLYKKILYLDKIDADINNILLILDYSNFNQKEDSRHLFIQPPLINDNTVFRNFQFHWSNFKSFSNAIFLKSYITYFYIGKYDQSMETVLNNIPFEYDNFTGELRNVASEQKIQKGVFYDKEKMMYFANVQQPDSVYPVCIGDNIIDRLKEIKHIFDNHNTSYRIVISPLFNQIKFNEVDLACLKEIFGEEYVYDFSGVNTYTEDYHNYYESSHYRPHVSRDIMNIIYK